MNFKKLYPLLLIYLVIITLGVTAVSLSRFTTVTGTKSTVSVAKPIFAYEPVAATLSGVSIATTESGISLENIEAGDVLQYQFKVNNYKAVNASQVLLKYKVNVIFDPITSSLPLTYTLAPGGSYTPAGDGWTYMGFGSQISHSYMLTVNWPLTSTSAIYDNKHQTVRIEINAEQADH